MAVALPAPTEASKVVITFLDFETLVFLTAAFFVGGVGIFFFMTNCLQKTGM